MATTPATKKAPTTKKSAAAGKTTASKPAAGRKATTKPKATTKSKGSKRATALAAVDRTAELSQDVLKSIESAQRAALEAVRKFVDTVDEVLPALGERPSRREKVLDAALEMADKLVTTQYEFMRKTVASADRSMRKAGADDE